MGLPSAKKRLFTVEEYLNLEHTALEKHEFRDGRIVPLFSEMAENMAGGTDNHSLITANVIGELHRRLKGKPCRVYESKLRIRIPRKTLYTYPDATVICDRPQIDPDDPNRQTTLNPRLIVEVLSDSTEAYDRGDKFSRYREIESFQEYILVSQAAPRIEVFLRQDDGTWLFTPFSGLDMTARLRSIDVDLPLRDVYEGVEFPLLADETPDATDQSHAT